MSTDRSVRANNNNRTSGVGTFGHAYIQNQADDDQFNIKTRAYMGDPEAQRMLDPNDPDNLTSEQVRAVYEAAVRADKIQQDEATNIENGKAFIAGHPEYIPSEANNQLMNHELKSKFGLREYTLAEYDHCYASLRASNFLKLDKTVVAAQQNQAAKQRYADGRAAEAKRLTNLSEAELLDLPLEEIRRLEAIERQKQLQMAGERGGNDW
jgi:hypothetical protein